MGWHVTLSIGGETTAANVVKLFRTASDMHLQVEQTGSTAEWDLERHRADIEAGRLDGFLRASDGTLCFEHYDHEEEALEDLEMLCEEIGLPFNREISSDDEIDGSIGWSRPGVEEMGRCTVNRDGEPVLRVSDVIDAKERGTLDALLAEAVPARLPPLTVVDAR